MKNTLLLLLSTVTLLFACQSEPKKKEKEVFSNLYVRYLQAEKSLTAEAVYKEGDSLLNATLIEYQTVLFNDTDMEIKRLPNKQLRYKLTQKIDFPEKLTFSFITPAGKREQQNISASPILSFKPKENISKSKGGQLTWVGQPLTKFESLVLLFSNEEKVTTSIILQGPTRESSIKMPASKLRSLTTGTGELYLVKKTRGADKSGRLNISSTIEYYSEKIKILVSD